MVSRPMTWDELVEVITHQNQEIVKLRKVAEAARVLSDIWSVGGKPNFSNLRYALAELDKEGGE